MKINFTAWFAFSPFSVSLVTDFPVPVVSSTLCCNDVPGLDDIHVTFVLYACVTILSRLKILNDIFN